MAPYADGLLVAAESALFFARAGALQLSPASVDLHPLGVAAMTARVADDDGDGADETHLAIRAEGAAYEIEGSDRVQWTVDGEDGPPTAIFAQKARVLLAFGPRAYAIDKAAGEALPLPAGIGRIRAIACGSLACDDGSLLYLASDAGLVERGADGAYTLYPLAAKGDPAIPVDAFALDAAKQRLYALAGPSVLRVRAGERPDAVATLDPPESARSMAVDKTGDVWIGHGTSLHRLALGTPLGFATDVRPIMHEYCAGCHAAGANGAPVIDFEDHDVMTERIGAVLERVGERSMPPASYDKKLPKEKILILQDWSATKAP
jgi:hypothetical protein